MATRTPCVIPWCAGPRLLWQPETGSSPSAGVVCRR